MKSIKFILLVGVLALLPLLAGGGKAQTSDPEGVTSPSGAVEAAVSYQGVLTAPDGTPLSGTYDLEFTFWSADSGGWQMGPATSRFGETITNGLYSTKLEVAPAIFNGQEAWLRIRVRETGSGTWEILDPRVQVLPTVYALGLRPEARIVGDVNVPNAIVMATNTSSGWGLRGESTEPTGYGVYGYNGSFSPAAYGGGVIGITRTDGYGVRGEAPSSGDFSYGGYFTGRVGVRGFGTGSYPNGYGGYFLSQQARGIYARGMGGYAGYFDGPIWVNGATYPRLAGRTLVVNDSDEALEPGDVVAISGVAEPLMAGGEPLLAVHKASGAADTAVVGVVAEAMLVQEVERPEDPLGQKSIDVQPVEGNVLPGGYLAIVTNGLVPAVKVSGVAAESLRIGDLLSPASAPGKVQRAESQYSPGTILGKVAGPYDPKTGTVPVFVILQ